MRVSMTEVCSKNGLTSFESSPGARAAIEMFEWPGNVRELANRCESAVVNARIDGAKIIEARHLFPEALPGHRAPRAPGFHGATAQFQAQFPHDGLRNREWNISQVARDMSLTRSHIYTLIQKFGLHREP